MEAIISLENKCDDFEVEFEVLPPDILTLKDERQIQIDNEIANIDAQISVVNARLKELNEDIDKLKNHADGLDYAIAVTSGIITGIIDAIVVGEWNFEKAKSEAHKEINNKVVNFAKKQPDYIPYCNKNSSDPDSLDTAIKFLEKKFHLPGDGAYSEGNYGISGKTHRLDDMCHHPTLIGLICCVIVQFTGKTLYVNKYGEDINIPIIVNDYGEFVGKNIFTKMFAGVVNWFIICAKTIANRKGHLMSDIATPTGLPGSFLSMITELASIDCFRNEKFLKKLRQAFTKGIGKGNGQVDLGIFNKLFEGAQSKFDISTEKAIVHELKRQALPVVINEALVRGAYFVRRFISELKIKKDIFAIEWSKLIPFKNRTIARMMTIATGTFTTIDMADAAVHAAKKKSIDVSSFFSNMLLRVNFVGVGRFVIASTVDVGMGVSKCIKQNARIKIREQELLLLGAKLSYKQAGRWISAENTNKTLEQAYKMMEDTTIYYAKAVEDMKNNLESIGNLVPYVEEKNPGLLNELCECLKWG